MKIIQVKEVDNIVECPKGGFTSHRLLTKSDNLGYTITKTIIPVNGKHFWHYKHHVESCVCVKGEGILTNGETGERHKIEEDVAYILNKNEPHYFEAIKEVTLICVFTPALKGDEIHCEEGTYPSEPQSPVYNVLSIPIDKVQANDYNPNAVAPPEMELLETSIWEDGYTQPVVTYYDKDNDKYVVVDGFHRFLTLKNSKRINEREKGMLPVVVIDKAIGDRMASTIRHNRARGTHNIELMSSIVTELVEMGKGDRWICQHIGMSPDELLRLKQITGLSALFKDQDFSNSWEAEAE
jgi:hypothetical protein